MSQRKLTQGRRAKNRRRVHWQPLKQFTDHEIEGQYKMLGRPRPHWMREVWHNKIYVVWVTYAEHDRWGEVTHIMVQRQDGKPVRDWAHMQRIKNEVTGPERVAFEVFPAESGLADSHNIYHMWVIPTGESLGVSLHSLPDCGRSGRWSSNAPREARDREP